jgi:hypothetical protein
MLKEGLKPEFVVEDSSFLSVQETSSTIEDKLVSRGFSEIGIKGSMKDFGLRCSKFWLLMQK